MTKDEVFKAITSGTKNPEAREFVYTLSPNKLARFLAIHLPNL